MDLMSDDAIAAFGLLVGEAIERLVNEHDESLDKRAAMLTVDSPTLSREGRQLKFEFKVKGNRQPTAAAAIDVQAELDDEDEDFDHSPDSTSLKAIATCECAQFKTHYQCSHTLSTAWWLQEQLGRRSISDVLNFLGELEVDSVSIGRDLVDNILTLAEESSRPAETSDEETRLQWRIGFSRSRYYAPLSITPYEQKPRKNKKGWTKGKEIRGFELLKRDFTAFPIDGKISALVASRSYSFDEDHYAEFQALQSLVGHPNVGWADGDASDLDVYSAELSLTLEPVERDLEEEEEQHEDNHDPHTSATHFRPVLHVSGFSIDIKQCEVVMGHSSPVEPLVILADRKHNRLIVCTLRDPRATRVIQFLLKSDLQDAVLDAESAARLAVGCATVDSLVRVNLPPELAGPITPITGELVFELRPRPGAGLLISLAIHDDRFREVLAPGAPPNIVPCLTDKGPIRLQRDLDDEKQRADSVVERFEFNKLSPDANYRWVAESDEAALDLLGRLYEGGSDAPRIIWPEGQSIRVRGELTPSALRVQIDDKRDWFGLTGSVTIDGQDISLADLLAAVREDRALVRVGDREFAKISESFRRRLQQLGDVVVSDRDSMKIADAAMPVVQELISDDVVLEATARWHESVKRLESLADWSPEKPEGLDAELRDYQLDGYRWLARLSKWGVGGVLADDMGLGKTVQTLGVLLDRAQLGPSLVIAPTSVGDNWVRETERFTPSLKSHLYRDSDRQQLIDSVGPGDLVIVSYQLVQRDAKKFATRDWSTLILDEAQFIKNSQTKTSQAIRLINADWRIGLSGTPLENHLGELWSLFRTLSPGLLGSWDRFRNRFADPIERHKDDKQRQSLARLVRPFILRRTKDKVLKELPARTEITLHAELSKAERKRYEDVRIAALAELSGESADASQAGQQRIRTLAWLTRLRQLACHPRLVDPTWKKGSAKLELLMNLVEELREGEHRALVFSQFVKHLGVIREALDAQGIEYQYLDGATPAAERQRRVDAFQNGEGELFLISLKAGGTGLNLTSADYVIHLDPWWNPAVEDQATDRAHRIGQQKPVTVYRLVAEGTIEEQILQLHADKRELVAGVLDGTDRAARMNTDELIKLIREGAR
ncbi:DEAD/DEAH box helicase [Novipirellula rosea]|uniref:ATP-dependent helicase HepA n=1 Tax=Novipirellula rosea TaxID=1031540 RepID=A0ABP8MYE8_9BACT|tara:strand:+ start:7756 stop:11112 length:3357 start_codon:yes stop_codon:yes gene_type:complete